MVVAIRVGLFSSAVNEMWNTTIIALRDKVRNFGLDEANQFLTTQLDEKKFGELKDKELLDISVELGLLGEDSYFFLNHCREIRNKYSSAHPSNSMLDGEELNYFIHQNVKQVLSNEIVFVGFRSDEFINTIKGKKLSSDAIGELLDISVMLTPISVILTPLTENGSKNRKHDNITSFFLNSLPSIQSGAKCVQGGLK